MPLPDQAIASDPESTTPFLNANVLVVEDEFLVADGIAADLQQLGHHVLAVAHTASEAQAAMQRQRPDLVLLDIHLEGQSDGLELAMHLHAEQIPFIFLTSHSASHIVHVAREAQPHGYLLKPVRIELLDATLQVVLFRLSHAKQQQAEREQRLLLETSKAVAEAKTVHHLLSLIHSVLPAVLDFEASILYGNSEVALPAKLTPSRHQTYSSWFQPLPPDAIGKLSAWHTAHPKEDTLVWPAIELPQPDDSQMQLHRMRHVFLLPLLANEVCLGYIALLASTPLILTGKVRELSHAMAEFIAVAVQNVLAAESRLALHRQSSQQLQLLDSLERHVTWQQRLEGMLDTLQEIVPFDLLEVCLETEVGNQQHFFWQRIGKQEYRLLSLEALQTMLRLSPAEFAKRLKQHAISAAQRLDETGFRKLRQIDLWVQDLNTAFGVRAMAALPFGTRQGSMGWIACFSLDPNAYLPPHQFLLPLMPTLILALEKHLANDQLRRDNWQLQEQTAYLQQEVNANSGFEGVIGDSPSMRRILHRIQQIAPSDAAVLIVGETGTGKELVARAIHQYSTRRSLPLIKVNCAALPEHLIESELFGHEKGAFTGAIQRRIGKFELAHNGTIFLDEIGELPLGVQAKLLRVLQEKEFERLGGNNTVRADFRVIAATNRNLPQAVASGTFRSDLFFRLNVIPVEVPPLRDRQTDLLLLLDYFGKRCAQHLGVPYLGFSTAARQRIQQYHWPGNIRELENMVEQAVLLSGGQVLDFLPPVAPSLNSQLPGGSHMQLEQVSMSYINALQDDVERNLIQQVLHETKWRIRGEGGAAQWLKVKPTTLESRMAKLGIKR